MAGRLDGNMGEGTMGFKTTTTLLSKRMLCRLATSFIRTAAAGSDSLGCSTGGLIRDGRWNDACFPLGAAS